MPRHEQEYASVGTVAEVVEQVRLPGGGSAVVLNGLHRGVLGAAQTDPFGRLRVEAEDRPDEHPRTGRIKELEVEYRAVVEEILELRGADERVSAFLRSIVEPGALADSAGYSPEISFEHKVELLETLDVTERLELAVRLQRERLAELQVRRRIRDDVESGAQRQQREYFLRKQMDSIRKELGEDGGSVAEEYRTKIEEAGMPEAVREQAERELRRLETMGEGSGEVSMIRTYLDWLVSVPWSKRSEEHLDVTEARADPRRRPRGPRGRQGPDRRVPGRAQAAPGARHRRRPRSGRDPDPDRASRAPARPRSASRSRGRSDASSCGCRSAASATRPRSAGIGAPISAPCRAGSSAPCATLETMNPVIMLDEVDKVGADWRGDPSAALLEVLDPAQNHSFRDHYLDVEMDLSEVLFIATANIADTIPGPLLDRMEVIPFDGYTVEEKVAIARGYLWPRQLERNGLRADEVSVTDEILRLVVTEYTREAGVRQLERELGTVLRKVATKIAIRGETSSAVTRRSRPGA